MCVRVLLYMPLSEEEEYKVSPLSVCGGGGGGGEATLVHESLCHCLYSPPILPPPPPPPPASLPPGGGYGWPLPLPRKSVTVWCCVGRMKYSAQVNYHQEKAEINERRGKR